jgi:hypothetical protein
MYEFESRSGHTPCFRCQIAGSTAALLNIKFFHNNTCKIGQTNAKFNMVNIVAMKCSYLLLGIVLLMCLNSCKKDAAPPATPTIIGKWFITKQASEVYNNGVKVEAFTVTSFTTDDYIEFDSGGTGFNSSASSTGPSLAEFTFTLKGTALTIVNSVAIDGAPETVTSLTANGLAIHAVSQVPDPNDPTVLDTEVDDFTYSR